MLGRSGEVSVSKKSTRVARAVHARTLAALERLRPTFLLDQEPACAIEGDEHQGCYMFAPGTPERVACRRACRMRGGE